VNGEAGAAAAPCVVLGLLLLLGPTRAPATTLTGPFVGCQQATENVITDGVTFTTGGVQYPVPNELEPVSDFSFHRVPGTSILVSQRGGGTTCVGTDGTPGHVLFFHDFPPTPGDPLVALRTDVCINEQVGQAGHCLYDRPGPFSSQRVVAVRERTGFTTGMQRTRWIDLNVPPPTAPDPWTTHPEPIQLTSYSPAGDAAVIQHDLDDPIGDPDWAVIDLCPGSRRQRSRQRPRSPLAGDARGGAEAGRELRRAPHARKRRQRGQPARLSRPPSSAAADRRPPDGDRRRPGQRRRAGGDQHRLRHRRQPQPLPGGLPARHHGDPLRHWPQPGSGLPGLERRLQRHRDERRRCRDSATRSGEALTDLGSVRSPSGDARGSSRRARSRRHASSDAVTATR
jgi:hypothetical protein